MHLQRCVFSGFAVCSDYQFCGSGISADPSQSEQNTVFKRCSCDLTGTAPIGAGLLPMYAIQALCKYYVTCQGHMMGARMERDMRQELFEHYENCRSLIIISIIPVR